MSHHDPRKILPPGSTIGIFGGGQLGRMLAMSARAMDYRTVSLDPAADCPASQVCDDHIVAAYDDSDAAIELASRSDVVTYEFENVDAAAIDEIAERTEVLPSPSVLRITQDRAIEKKTMRELGINVPEFRIASNRGEAVSAARHIGLPAVFKTTRWGYDGKGQRVVQALKDAASAFDGLTAGMHDARVIVEALVDFQLEISVICARDRDGRMKTFPPSENVHVNGILDLSVVPARCGEETQESARAIAMRIAERMDVVGLIAVEMFVTPDGVIAVNETAPRPHNSGHYSIENCDTSQFEQLTRILTGTPMGKTDLWSACAMANLLGDMWHESESEPDWGAALALPGLHLHLYGKSEARIGRKMGHLTVSADDAIVALDLAVRARDIARGQAASKT